MPRTAVFGTSSPTTMLLLLLLLVQGGGAVTDRLGEWTCGRDAVTKKLARDLVEFDCMELAREFSDCTPLRKH